MLQVWCKTRNKNSETILRFKTMLYISIAIIFLFIQILIFGLAYYFWRTTKNFDECWDRLSDLEDNFSEGREQMQHCLDAITDILNKHGNAINKNTEELGVHQKAIDYLLKNE